MRVETVEQHSFIPDQLREGAVVLDLGMAVGGFAKVLAARYGARVVGVEPVVEYAKVVTEAGFEVLQAAVASEAGEVTLHVHSSHGGSVVQTLGAMERVAMEVPAVTLDDVLRHYDLDVVDLVKMDIEGAELAVLERVSPRTLGRFKQITVEFHAFLDPEQRQRVEMVTTRLQGLGFAALDFSNARLTDVLFVNRSRIQLSRAQRYALLLRYKYLRGVRRAALRHTTRPPSPGRGSRPRSATLCIRE